MSEIKNEKADNESESSELFNEEEKDKNANIISSSSDEENNQNNANTNNNNTSNNNNIEDQKLLGNKRPLPKDQKEIKEYDSRKKIKKSFSEANKNFQPSLDIPLVTYDLFCQLYTEKEGDSNLSKEEFKKFYDEYKFNHEIKNNEQFFVNHKSDEWFLEKYNPNAYVQFNQKERSIMCQNKAKLFFDKYDIENVICKKEIKDIKDDNKLTQKINYIFDLKEEHEYNKNIKIIYTRINTAENKIEEFERDLNNIPLNKEIIQKELENHIIFITQTTSLYITLIV